MYRWFLPSFDIHRNSCSVLLQVFQNIYHSAVPVGNAAFSLNCQQVEPSLQVIPIIKNAWNFIPRWMLFTIECCQTQQLPLSTNSGFRTFPKFNNSVQLRLQHWLLTCTESVIVLVKPVYRQEGRYLKDVPFMRHQMLSINLMLPRS